MIILIFTAILFSSAQTEPQNKAGGETPAAEAPQEPALVDISDIDKRIVGTFTLQSISNEGRETFRDLIQRRKAACAKNQTKCLEVAAWSKVVCRAKPEIATEVQSLWRDVLSNVNTEKNAEVLLPRLRECHSEMVTLKADAYLELLAVNIKKNWMSAGKKLVEDFSAQLPTVAKSDIPPITKLIADFLGNYNSEKANQIRPILLPLTVAYTKVLTARAAEVPPPALLRWRDESVQNLLDGKEYDIYLAYVAAMPASVWQNVTPETYLSFVVQTCTLWRNNGHPQACIDAVARAKKLVKPGDISGQVSLAMEEANNSMFAGDDATALARIKTSVKLSQQLDKGAQIFPMITLVAIALGANNLTEAYSGLKKLQALTASPDVNVNLRSITEILHVMYNRKNGKYKESVNLGKTLREKMIRESISPSMRSWLEKELFFSAVMAGDKTLSKSLENHLQSQIKAGSYEKISSSSIKAIIEKLNGRSPEVHVEIVKKHAGAKNPDLVDLNSILAKMPK